MSKGLLSYGRYPDGHIGCPRAKTDMTPCVARDGTLAQGGDVASGPCVGCGEEPADLLVALVKAVTEPLVE